MSAQPDFQISPKQARARLNVSRTIFDANFKPFLTPIGSGRSLRYDYAEIRSVLERYAVPPRIPRPVPDPEPMQGPPPTPDTEALLREIAMLRKEDYTDDDPTHVYLISPAKYGIPVKIGIARDPRSRLNDLQTAHYNELMLMASFRIRSRLLAGRLELLAHQKFAPRRQRGEWFRVDWTQPNKWIGQSFGHLVEWG